MKLLAKLALISISLGGLAGILATPATAISCHTGPFIIFFEADSAALDSRDMEVLDRVVEISGNPCFMNSLMMLGGHSDTGSDSNHRHISKMRNKSVFRYLVQKQIKKSRIKSKAFGKAYPLIYAAAGVAEAQNRRVEISFGPPKI